jgi:AraC family transcriptional regulator
MGDGSQASAAASAPLERLQLFFTKATFKLGGEWIGSTLILVGDTSPGGSGSARVLHEGQYYGAVVRRHRASGLVLSELRHRGALRMPRHAHQLAFFSLVLAGSYDEEVGSRRLHFRPLCGMFRPAALCHRDEIGPAGGRFFNVEMEPAWIENLRDYAPLPSAAAEFAGGELSWLGLRLYGELQRFDHGSPMIVEGLALEMLGTLARATQASPARMPPWLRRVTERLEAEYSRRLTVRELAADAGVHPVHLARVFRRFHGRSPGEHLQRRRVQAVCAALAHPDGSLAEAALAAGFADQSHCSRVFKRITGATPRAFRASLRRQL